MNYTRAIKKRKMLAMLLMFTANLFFSQVGAMAQKGRLAPQAPTGDCLDCGLGTDDYWTTVGSTGTVDEEDLSIVDLTDFYVGHKAGQTGTVNIRYNIVAIEGANQGDGVLLINNAHLIRVRYRDSDGHGENVRVAFSIWRTNIFNGVDEKIYTFDSNTDGGTSTVGQTFEGTDCEAGFDFDFDFSTYFFWIDAEVTRNNTTGVARLSAIQITETSSPCSGSPTSTDE